MKSKTVCIDAAKTLLLLAAATALNALLAELAHGTKTASDIYILSVLLVSLTTTNGYVCGLLASVAGVIGVNYFFTYPFNAFNFTIEGYPVTFLCMLLAAVITSTLVSSLKKQMNKERQLELEKQAEQIRGSLLRAISHDLRTPLTGILGASSAILENGEKIDLASRDALLTDIHDDAEWLLRMVENVLSVTRLSDGAPALHKVAEPVEEVVAQAAERARRRFPGAKLRVTVPDELLMVSMDGTLIVQVLLNLIENAFRHGGADVSVELSVTGAGREAAFVVRDDGRGISETVLPDIFTGFASREREDGDKRGLGIGLSICKAIVTAHGGTIAARNAEGGGAEFRFTLPAEEENHGG